MDERHYIFLTGRLAKPRLERVLAGLADPGFTFEVRDMGVKVAALLTEPIIRRRLAPPVSATAVFLPGRCRMDLASLSAHFGVPFRSAGRTRSTICRPSSARTARTPTSSSTTSGSSPRSSMRRRSVVEELVARARALGRQAAADVIDLGCQPGRGVSASRGCRQALKGEGFKVSVDFGDDRGAAPRRQGRRRLRAQPDRRDLALAARQRRRCRCCCQAAMATSTRCARPWTRREARGLPDHGRSGARSDPFRLHESLLRYAKLRPRSGRMPRC